MSRKLPSTGEIFVQRGKKIHTKPASSAWKITGVIGSMLFIVLGVNAAVVAGQNAWQAEKAKIITDNVAESETPGIMRFLPQARTPSLNTVRLAQQTGFDDTAHTIPTPTQTPINAPSADLNNILNQLNRANSNIVSNMYACIRLTQQAYAQTAQLRATEQQMKATMDQIRQQERSLNTNDPDTPSRRAQLRAQREQIYAQRTQVLNTIRDVRRQYAEANNACRNSVYNQQRTKRNLENQLNEAFRNATNVRFP